MTSQVLRVLEAKGRSPTRVNAAVEAADAACFAPLATATDSFVGHLPVLHDAHRGVTGGRSDPSSPARR